MSVADEDNYDGQAIALSRLAIDRSFIGDGRGAIEAISALRFDKMQEDAVKLRLLDFGTSVALNTIRANDFIGLNSVALESLDGGWLTLSEFESEPRKIAELAPKFGVGIFTMAQRAGLKGVQNSYKLNDAIKSAREQWTGYIKDTMSHVGNVPNWSDFAEDFLYSLHRPTFHAVAGGDLEQARSMLNYYFGRDVGHSPYEQRITTVRQKFLTNMPGSSPWMFLLDLKYGQPKGRVSIFENLIRNGKSQSPQLKSALVNVAPKFGLNRESALSFLNETETSNSISENAVHQVYMNCVT